jgi:DNA-binding transcriptional ArsR family regulator
VLDLFLYFENYQNMETKGALAALSALAQETRLEVFRLLVRAGPTGLAAGAVAERIGVQPATLSFHLRELERAGLLTARRESRQIFYAPDFRGMRALLAFLTEDCCGGHPEICAVLGTGVRAGRGAESEETRP